MKMWEEYREINIEEVKIHHRKVCQYLEVGIGGRN